ncbi:dihydropteroate synthase [Glaciihabitans arcticus]|uniref:Dihydropteroate synthase n=1 Tax=Glaciihabitans arcticus TaxID=2668039 RepID=A0A4Q9GU46_9MICO|nr:dihydropteroate synthase [Glaciihabitans arcticus]TBN58636.1 dihydropteroate synthase [Glaciihabitans arcticus]
MGILNVTPDSFSDGGEHNELEAAVAHAVALVEAGADLIDVGGESTRPGAERVPEGEELERVLPVITELASRGIRVSVDTMRASTAKAAVEAGAEIVNDVSGGLADPEMYRTIAATGASYVAMHWRAPSDEMHTHAVYGDVVTDVRSELKARVAELIVWGVAPEKIIIDPGIGFSKNAAQNWSVLGHLDALVTLGCPVLVGVSRKRFLGELLPEDAPAADRDGATAIVSALAAQAGVWGVRVHDVKGTKFALDVWSAWEGARS